MTKKILALALAGTTAFSVFGGLNVFAVSANDVYNSYTPVHVTYTYAPEGDKSVAINNDASLDYSVETVMDFDDVMETTIADKTIYLYDFYDDYIDTKNYSISDIENALDDETDPKAAFAEILAKGSDSSGWQPVTKETGYGERRTIRKEIVDAFEDFIDEISLDPADYDYKDTTAKDPDIYHFEDLLDDISTQVTGDAYVNAASSQLVYLMQQYDYYVGGGLVDATDYDTDYLDMVIEILQNRSIEDFKSSNTYTRSYVFELEDLLDDYDSAKTIADYKAVLADAEDLLFKFSGAATADKAELKDALNGLFYNVSYTKYAQYPAAGAAGEYVLYPAVDFTEDGDTTAEYDHFVDVYEFASKMVGLGRNYAYQSDMEYVTDLLTDAVADLIPTTTPRASALMIVEEALEDYGNKIESDYKAGWAAYENAIEFAQSVLEGNPGQRQTTNAAAIVEKAADALTAKSVPASTMKALRAAIKDAEEWLKENDNYTSDKNAAQILAVRKALDTAEDVLADSGRLISETENAIDGVENALNYAGVVLGWSKNADDKWVYATEDGYLNNGWNKINNCWYYFNADGTAKQNEWFKDGNDWFWLTNSCNAAHGWYKINGDWYFFRDGGYMVTGWRMVNGLWYYMDASGKMQTGWVNVGGKSYYLSKEAATYGAMLANTTTPDGYKVGADGAWIK